MRSRLRTVAMLTPLFIIIGSALGASATGAPAPSPRPSPSATPGVLDRVVVTAERRPTPLRSTAREVYIISGEQLRRFDTLGDALRFVPGSLVHSYGSLGALQTVALRGASSEQTLVLIDGRPVNEADTGVLDFSGVPLDGVERIEIVEGGASTLYGSAAVGGVINIITQDRAPDDAYLEVGYAGAVSSGFGVAQGDERSLLARIDFRHSRAQDVFAYPAFLGAPAGDRTNNDADVQDWNASIGHAFGSLRASLRIEDNASNIGTPGPDLSGPPAPCCISYLARQQRYVGRSELALSAQDARGTWALEVYSDDQRLHFYDLTPPFPFDDLTHVATHGFGLRRAAQLGAADTLTIGYDSRADRATLGAPSTVSDSTTAWYAQDDVHPPGARLSFSAGMRAEHTQGTLPSTLPSIGVQLQVAGDMLLRAQYARAFRAPDLDERYFPGFGNPALQPEYAGTGEVGVVKSFKSGVAMLTAFGSDTSNLIVSEPIDAFGDVEPFNVNRATVRGVNADVQLTARGSSVHLAYTDYFVAKDLTAGTRLLYRPTATGSVEFLRTKGHQTYGVHLNFVGRRFADETNATLLPAYAALGFLASARLGGHYTVSARIENLLRNHAEDQLGFPVNGPTLTVRLEARR